MDSLILNFPEDVPNFSQRFISFVDQVYCFFKTCTYSPFIYTISTKLFVPSAITIFQFLQSKLNLNMQAITPNFQFTNIRPYFSCIFVLGKELNCLFDPCIDKTLILFMLNRN